MTAEQLRLLREAVEAQGMAALIDLVEDIESAPGIRAAIGRVEEFSPSLAETLRTAVHYGHVRSNQQVRETVLNAVQKANISAEVINTWTDIFMKIGVGAALFTIPGKKDQTKAVTDIDWVDTRVDVTNAHSLRSSIGAGPYRMLMRHLTANRAYYRELWRDAAHHCLEATRATSQEALVRVARQMAPGLDAIMESVPREIADDIIRFILCLLVAREPMDIVYNRQNQLDPHYLAAWIASAELIFAGGPFTYAGP